MRKIRRRIVSALIFSADGKLLMGRKPPHRAAVYIDCWHIPGGGVDENETDEQTLQREVSEEVGIDISNYLTKIVDDEATGEAERTLKSGEKVLCKMHFIVYRVDINDKNANQIKLIANDDLENLTWFPISELKAIKLTPPSEELFKKLGYLE